MDHSFPGHRVQYTTLTSTTYTFDVYRSAVVQR